MMTDSFRLLLASAETIPTDWPGVSCFKVHAPCVKCAESGIDTPVDVYGINGRGEVETKYRYQIVKFYCFWHLDGETMPNR